MNENAPHKVVIWVTAQVHEVNSAGECTGNVVQSHKRTIQLEAANKYLAIQRMNNWFDEVPHK